MKTKPTATSNPTQALLRSVSLNHCPLLLPSPWTTPAPGAALGTPLQSPCPTLGKCYPSSTPLEDAMTEGSPVDISRLSCSESTAETTWWRLAQAAKPTLGGPASSYPPPASPSFAQPVFCPSAPRAGCGHHPVSKADAAEPSYCC